MTIGGSLFLEIWDERDERDLVLSVFFLTAKVALLGLRPNGFSDY